MHDKKRNAGNKHSLKLVSMAHSYAFLKVEPFAHTEAGRNFLKNLTQNINTHIMYDIDNSSHGWDVKPYLTPEERVSRGYVLAPSSHLSSADVQENEITQPPNVVKIFPYRQALLSVPPPPLVSSPVPEPPNKVNTIWDIGREPESVEYLRSISNDVLANICANIGRPQNQKRKLPRIVNYNAYDRDELAKEYDELQQSIDALMQCPEPPLPDNIWTALYSNAVSSGSSGLKEHMDHEECPRLYSLWLNDTADFVYHPKSLSI